VWPLPLINITNRRRRLRLKRYVLLPFFLVTILIRSKTNGIFELIVKNEEGVEATWTIDMKNTGTVYLGSAKHKPDVTIILSDETMTQLADGKVRHYENDLFFHNGFLI
jgi:SCP-2 sterol transfer family